MNLEFVRYNKVVNSPGELIPATPQEIISKIDKNGEGYISLYQYLDHHFQHFKQTKSVKGIVDVKTNRLLWDFDGSKGQTIDDARTDAQEICNRLLEKGVPSDKIRPFFSGSKGFHIEVLLNESLTRQEFVNIVFDLAGDLQTFDTSINDCARIIRAPFSKHPQSGLHKIPITLNQLNNLTIDRIKELATTELVMKRPIAAIYTEENYRIDTPELIGELKTKMYKKVADKNEIKEIKGFDITDIDFTKCPKWMSKERYALQEGFFYGSEHVNVGERNKAFLILAATYKNQGFSEDHTLRLLEATAELQAQRTSEDIVSTERLQREVISAVYTPGWKGGIFAKDEPLLVLTRHRFNIVDLDITKTADLVKINDVGSEFSSYAKNIDQNTVKTGLKRLDDSVLITSGMMVSLLAAPGAGKTSFANLFVENLSKTGENTIYFSLDMYKNLLFTRLLQKYSGYNMQRILNLYKEDRPDEKLKQAYADVISNFENVYFNFRSGPTVEEIEQEIINYKETSGKNPKLVVIDYLEKVKGPFSDATANSGYVASRLADIANKHHLVVLLLVQPQKIAGDPSDELTSYRRIKGASVIEQDSRVIMTLSRPGYNPKDTARDCFASISVVKNNMGGLCQLDYKWEGVTGALTDMSQDDVKDLKELREELQKAKAKESNGYF